MFVLAMVEYGKDCDNIKVMVRIYVSVRSVRVTIFLI